MAPSLPPFRSLPAFLSKAQKSRKASAASGTYSAVALAGATHGSQVPEPLIATDDADLRRGTEASTGPVVLGATVAEAVTEAPSAFDDGLTIQQYAQRFQVSEAEVWRLLRHGELIGRTQRGRLFIYDSAAAAGSPELASEPRALTSPAPVAAEAKETPEAIATEGDFAFLPPLPPVEQLDIDSKAGATAAAPAATGGFLSLSGERSTSPEMALLLDHLSLAKEENREILRLTQDSIRKVSELSQALVQMKDTVIEAKEAEVMALREQLAARDKELRRLQQNNEDLEMLARTVVQG